MLFGLIFFIPFFGLAIGALTGALMGKFTDYGISDQFIKEENHVLDGNRVDCKRHLLAGLWRVVVSVFPGGGVLRPRF
ncbi:DUF1269 domain-containing protein [Caldilinea sp.]|uniref:DUF1269 domain-containing protein n=1 Tax=Caldilinea sp. TaxID=2293560 RepID=UPI0035B555B1